MWGTPNTVLRPDLASMLDIRNKNLSQPTGKHFNSRGHSSTNMSFVILEKVMSDDVLLREERESNYIRT